jgi:hypothetical protein
LHAPPTLTLLCAEVSVSETESLNQVITHMNALRGAIDQRESQLLAELHVAHEAKISSLSAHRIALESMIREAQALRAQPPTLQSFAPVVPNHLLHNSVNSIRKRRRAETEADILTHTASSTNHLNYTTNYHINHRSSAALLPPASTIAMADMHVADFMHRAVQLATTDPKSLIYGSSQVWLGGWTEMESVLAGIRHFGTVGRAVDVIDGHNDDLIALVRSHPRTQCDQN